MDKSKKHNSYFNVIYIKILTKSNNFQSIAHIANYIKILIKNTTTVSHKSTDMSTNVSKHGLRHLWANIPHLGPPGVAERIQHPRPRL